MIYRGRKAALGWQRMAQGLFIQYLVFDCCYDYDFPPNSMPYTAAQMFALVNDVAAA